MDRNDRTTRGKVRNIAIDPRLHVTHLLEHPRAYLCNSAQKLVVRCRLPPIHHGHIDDVPVQRGEDYACQAMAAAEVSEVLRADRPPHQGVKLERLAEFLGFEAAGLGHSSGKPVDDRVRGKPNLAQAAVEADTFSYYLQQRICAEAGAITNLGAELAQATPIVVLVQHQTLTFAVLVEATCRPPRHCQLFTAASLAIATNAGEGCTPASGSLCLPMPPSVRQTLSEAARVDARHEAADNWCRQMERRRRNSAWQPR
mmetsp:Transcript_88802/g.250137  ORF Transcript_88802/g.250137 Transcript_88802/m.250137 type:complete len:257 (+) Transcript_88802:346-1116(+)